MVGEPQYSKRGNGRLYLVVGQRLMWSLRRCRVDVVVDWSFSTTAVIDIVLVLGVAQRALLMLLLLELLLIKRHAYACPPRSPGPRLVPGFCSDRR